MGVRLQFAQYDRHPKALGNTGEFLLNEGGKFRVGIVRRGRREGFFGTVHEKFAPDECGNYIRHSGYTATH